MDNEKIVNKLDWVIGEVQKELKGEDENLLKDLNSLLEKVIKNCEVSKKLIKDYQETKDKRLIIIGN